MTDQRQPYSLSLDSFHTAGGLYSVFRVPGLDRIPYRTPYRALKTCDHRSVMAVAASEIVR